MPWFAAAGGSARMFSSTARSSASALERAAQHVPCGVQFRWSRKLQKNREWEAQYPNSAHPGHDAVNSPAGDLIGPNGYGHTGFTGTSLWVDPDAGRYVVLLTNRVHPSRKGNAIIRVRRLIHNIAFADD